MKKFSDIHSERPYQHSFLALAFTKKVYDLWPNNNPCSKNFPMEKQNLDKNFFLYADPGIY